MRKFAAQLDPSALLNIAEFGSLDVNGSYRDLFPHSNWNYVGYDIREGPAVDFVLSDEHFWPELASDTFDVVISGSTLEHVRKPWLWMRSLARVLRPEGRMCVIVEHSLEFHAYPIDCWRVWPDGMRSLLEETNLEALTLYKTERDTVLIATKPAIERKVPVPSGNQDVLPISVCVPISPQRWNLFVETGMPSIVANTPAEIIIDDGSTRGPIVVAHEDCEVHAVAAHCRLRSLEHLQKTVGPCPEDIPTISANIKRNRAAAQATQPFLFFCDDDVILDPTCLATMLQSLQAHPEASYAYVDFLYVNHPTIGMRAHHCGHFDAQRLRQQNYISTHSLIRAAHFPGWDESVARLQDWDLWLTMLRGGHVGIWASTVPLFAAIYGADALSTRDGSSEAVATIHGKHKIIPTPPTPKQEKRRTQPTRDASRAIDLLMPTYGNSALTVKCVQSLARSTCRDDLRVVWIDNGSSAEERAATQGALTASGLMHLKIWNERNLGFVLATNQGLEEFLRSRAAYAVFLNNDVEVYAHTLAELRKGLAQHRAGIVGPVSTSGIQDWRRLQGVLGRDEVRKLENFGSEEARAAFLHEQHAGEFYKHPAFVAFFCAMTRRPVVQQLGLLDERFGMGFGEDDQWCAKASSAHFGIYFALGAYAYHAHRSTWRAIMSVEEIQAKQDHSLKELTKWRAELADS
jgi:GT2 family glycosyltransferase